MVLPKLLQRILFVFVWPVYTETHPGGLKLFKEVSDYDKQTNKFALFDSLQVWQTVKHEKCEFVFIVM